MISSRFDAQRRKVKMDTIRLTLAGIRRLRIAMMDCMVLVVNGDLGIMYRICMTMIPARCK